MSPVPTISITDPDLESKDYGASGNASPITPHSPTVFDVVKELENKEPLVEEDLAVQDDLLEEQPKTVHSFYHQKTILLTGATGFVGKALLWKLIQSLHDSVEKIIVLLRPSTLTRQQDRSPSRRLQDEILSNKAFVSLRRSMGAPLFDAVIAEKIYPVFGDVTLPSLGLEEEDHRMVLKYVNIIFNCAANVDGNERLDTSVKINAWGTVNLAQLANECGSLSAFVHLSMLQHCERVARADESSLYPLPVDDPVALLNTILEQENDFPMDNNDNVRDLLNRSIYSNGYLFSKSLAEHLLVQEVIKKRDTVTHQYPLSIMRCAPIGPAVLEPLIGWADGVNGANGTILLTGKGSRVIQPHFGDGVADVIPVDYVVRMLIGCAATMSRPRSSEFEIPTVKWKTQPGAASASAGTTLTDEPIKDEPVRTHRRTPSGSSRMSVRSSIYLPRISLPDQVSSFPAIYQLSVGKLRPVSWRIGYEAIAQYWNKATGANLPPSKSYFSASSASPNSSTSTPSPGGLSRARTVMNSLRSAAGYMNGAGTATGEVPAPSSSTPIVDRNAKRASHRQSRAVDKAAKLAYTMKDTIHSATPSLLQKDTSVNALVLINNVQSLDVHGEFDPSTIVPEDANAAFWYNYFNNASYGIHHYVLHEPSVRLPGPIFGWSCAIQTRGIPELEEDCSVVARQVNSSIFSQDQIVQRTARMVAHIKALLINNIPIVSANKNKDDAWLTDLDDTLDDWCQDSDVIHPDKERRMALGKWRRKVGSNDESVKIIVLNDKRVNQAITQITQNAGVPKQTAVNEAMKILMRMSERTQLAFVWFTGSFLRSLLDDMFEHVRILDDSLRSIRQATMGKRVVYVPVAKSLLDPLLVWYIAIRYQLPVPALACDEAMSQLGPVSDVYRLAGAYYLKRDKGKRSPLNSAVTAAYTQVLMREHGALSFCLERSRSRTGKYGEPYPDGLVEMVIEATLQSNQTTRTPSTSSSVISRVVSHSTETPPGSPDSSVPGTTSPTMSIDSLATLPSQQQQQQQVHQHKRVHRDAIFVPIHITYENLPELPHLIDEVLDQQQPKRNSKTPPSSPPRSIARPSEAMDKRNKLLDGSDIPKKGGRILFGVGPLVSVQEVADRFNRDSNSSTDENYQNDLVQSITKQIHKSQCKALIVSPTSLIASIILYGRATHGVCIGKIKDLMEWLRFEITEAGHLIDWQVGEDLDSLILSAFRLLDESKNIIVDGKEINDDTNIRVNDHADNVMALSYYANQIIDIFLLDSFFAIVYLSFVESIVEEDDFKDRFRFLVQLLEREFVLDWDVEEQFNTIIEIYLTKNMIRRQDNHHIQLLVNMEGDAMRYEHLVFLASLMYPTIDAYWITSCSLSALEAVPMLPRCIVPLLTQWIATHLITGRRTLYREVLSTESSRTAVDVFMSMGFLTEIHAKEKLSPDAQILLHELGIPTTEILIELSGQNSDGGKTPVSPIDPQGMMKAVMAQIEMNRANSNMADLCQQIDSYRLNAASQRETFQNHQVFQKCLKQIKGILQANTSFAKKRRIELPEDEDGLVQLVYSLLASSVPSGDRAAQARALRRISEAYNLR
ncbi:hypothetical protein K501DRAFT_252733 [Backusella circina FSU 941]|nr:hypothetical protein K501DRAFT_252733 [Backusella circina FSU 941]